MAYYVRKIARAKWEIPKGKDKVVESLRADAIANDLRTTKDTLSFWKAESLEPRDMEPIEVVNSLLGDDFATIKLLCVPEDKFAQLGLKIELNEEDADTVIEDCKQLHYNLISLDVKSLLTFADQIVLHILQDSSLSSDEHAPDSLVRCCQKKVLIKQAKRWLDEGRFSCESLAEKGKTKLIKALQKP